MAEAHNMVLTHHSAERMFALVDDVTEYLEFLRRNLVSAVRFTQDAGTTSAF